MKTKLRDWRPARYVIVGVGCAVLHNVIMILGDFLGINYVPMIIVSFFIVVPIGYALHAVYTFRKAMSWNGLLRFMSGLVAGFFVSLALMAIFCTGFGWPVVVASPLTTVMLFIWNYASAHWAILGRLRLADRSEI